MGLGLRACGLLFLWGFCRFWIVESQTALGYKQFNHPKTQRDDMNLPKHIQEAATPLI